jgi:hypothetical protein
MIGHITRRVALSMVAGLVLAAGGSLTVAPVANAEPMARDFSSCQQLRAEYANGIAKTQRAANRVVRRGYQRPIVCPRVYRQVAPALDPNGNRVACERR